ncbi:hypothetical protein AVEN_163349-1 [Araneus ventricosus]|uniref:Uncharacterized protein n=1 Tax=Araneus ventricosus TaxID=182803 RepID=A0A4Y2X9P4_ARAVE|nr:hypothetical protein AVEN_274489-1 [Araneus ventricosus]GBO46331.1 hypothetical protein AVEN_163349-1 [Araneus ventricosus]
MRFSLVRLTSRFEAPRGLFWDGPRNFGPRSDDEDDAWAGASSSSFRTAPAGGRLAFYVGSAGPIHGASSVESGFGPGALRPQSRDLTTRPPRTC